MDRAYKSGVGATPPTAPPSPAIGYPQSGDPVAGVSPTKQGAWWYHMMTEEMRNVIVAAGLTPDHTNLNQLSLAISALVSSAQKAVILSTGITFAAGVANGEAVYWDTANSRFDKALADGTVKQDAVGFADVTNSKVYAFGACSLFGLTPGKYYLSGSTAGAITATAPSNNIVKVGIATSATSMDVDIDTIGSESLGKNILHVRDEKPSGTAGGGSATGAWQTRTLNTVVANTIAGASLASNQITLPEGSYRVFASAPSIASDGHRLRLRNITDSSTPLLGTSDRSGTSNSVASRSHIHGDVFTISSSKVFELQHYTQTAKTIDGLGAYVGSGDNEIFADIVIWKE